MNIHLLNYANNPAGHYLTHLVKLKLNLKKGLNAKRILKNVTIISKYFVITYFNLELCTL